MHNKEKHQRDAQTKLHPSSWREECVSDAERMTAPDTSAWTVTSGKEYIRSSCFWLVVLGETKGKKSKEVFDKLERLTTHPSSGSSTFSTCGKQPSQMKARFINAPCMGSHLCSRGLLGRGFEIERHNFEGTVPKIETQSASCQDWLPCILCGHFLSHKRHAFRRFAKGTCRHL